MRVRALDGVNDWQFGKGRNDYKRDLNAISQNIQTRLMSFLGDCFFDLASGIDWFNLLGGKDKFALELAIASTILKTEFVTGILLLSVIETPDRRLTISYRVQTTLGEAGNEFIYDSNGIG